MLEMIVRPEIVGRSFGGYPMIHFEEREVGGKTRLIGVPNRAMRLLHQQFGAFLREMVHRTDKGGYGIRVLPSATGCVKGSNPLLNALRHRTGRCFYITDLVDAYANVSLEQLAVLVTFLVRYPDYEDDFSPAWFGQDERREIFQDDLLYQPVLEFLQAYFSGPRDQGLAVGGPLSPYLMNLYCEVYLDAPLRRLCEKREITYTRYVDDLVFSAKFFIGRETRRKLRALIEKAGFTLNRRKSRVELLSMGPVQVTKVGLMQKSVDGPTRIVFSQQKRRKLHGLIHSYLTGEMDWPERVSGYVAEFLYYYRKVDMKTATDRKTFTLCQQFKAEWELYGGPRYEKKKKKKR